MTDQQINAAIAAHLRITRKTGIPDFSGDLNEMHEAQQKLSTKEFVTYIYELMELHHEPMQSSARQRAEAFLRTLGKWEEV